MNNNTRPRGVMVYPMPAEVNGPTGDRYALLIRDGGPTLEYRMIHTEGVAYAVTPDKPWCWTDYNPTARKFTTAELFELAATVEPVDLADWVRTFGSRLEANFGMIHYWANSED